MSGRPNWGFRESCSFIIVLGKVVIAVVVSFLTGVLRLSSRVPQLKRHVTHAAIRTWIGEGTIAQLRSIAPTTDEVYASFVRKTGKQPQTEQLAHGASAHWIGPKSASKVLVWFHGGGYVNPANCHFDVLDVCISNVDDASVVVLSYWLVPDARYPVQLLQATELLRHLIVNMGKSPSNMLIGGDSAGGNLCFGLISHLIKPHAEIPPLDLAEPLRGALLVSPWVSFQTNAPSFKRNMGLDSIDRKFLERAEKAFLGNAKVDEYNQPLTARSEWWKELHCAVSKTFFVAGELEIFVDDIAALSKKVSCNNDGVQIMVIPGETHDQMFIDPMIGYGLDGVSARTVQKWIEIRLAHTKRE